MSENRETSESVEHCDRCGRVLADQVDVRAWRWDEADLRISELTDGGGTISISDEDLGLHLERYLCPACFTKLKERMGGV